jgi:hypothetical protein
MVLEGSLERFTVEIQEILSFGWLSYPFLYLLHLLVVLNQQFKFALGVVVVLEKVRIDQHESGVAGHGLPDHCGVSVPGGK